MLRRWLLLPIECVWSGRTTLRLTDVCTFIAFDCIQESGNRTCKPQSTTCGICQTVMTNVYEYGCTAACAALPGPVGVACKWIVNIVGCDTIMKFITRTYNTHIYGYDGGYLTKHHVQLATPQTRFATVLVCVARRAPVEGARNIHMARVSAFQLVAPSHWTMRST
jgi:hypothetical protein